MITRLRGLFFRIILKIIQNIHVQKLEEMITLM
jgi:hypothetical protein